MKSNRSGAAFAPKHFLWRHDGKVATITLNRPERKNPINRALIAIYRPVIQAVIRFPKGTLELAAAVLLVGLWPATQLGSDFMPLLDEGGLMYIPTT